MNINTLQLLLTEAYKVKPVQPPLPLIPSLSGIPVKTHKTVFRDTQYDNIYEDANKFIEYIDNYIGGNKFVTISIINLFYNRIIEFKKDSDYIKKNKQLGDHTNKTRTYILSEFIKNINLLNKNELNIIDVNEEMCKVKQYIAHIVIEKTQNSDSNKLLLKTYVIARYIEAIYKLIKYFMEVHHRSDNEEIKQDSDGDLSYYRKAEEFIGYVGNTETHRFDRYDRFYKLIDINNYINSDAVFMNDFSKDVEHKQLYEEYMCTKNKINDFIENSKTTDEVNVFIDKINREREYVSQLIKSYLEELHELRVKISSVHKQIKNPHMFKCHVSLNCYISILEYIRTSFGSSFKGGKRFKISKRKSKSKSKQKSKTKK